MTSRENFSEHDDGTASRAEVVDRSQSVVFISAKSGQVASTVERAGKYYQLREGALVIHCDWILL